MILGAPNSNLKSKYGFSMIAHRRHLLTVAARRRRPPLPPGDGGQNWNSSILTCDMSIPMFSDMLNSNMRSELQLSYPFGGYRQFSLPKPPAVAT